MYTPDYLLSAKEAADAGVAATVFRPDGCLATTWLLIIVDNPVLATHQDTRVHLSGCAACQKRHQALMQAAVHPPVS